MHFTIRRSSNLITNVVFKTLSATTTIDRGRQNNIMFLIIVHFMDPYGCTLLDFWRTVIVSISRVIHQNRVISTVYSDLIYGYFYEMQISRKTTTLTRTIALKTLLMTSCFTIWKSQTLSVRDHGEPIKYVFVSCMQIQCMHYGKIMVPF